MGPLTLAGLLYLGAAVGVLPFSFRGGSPRLMTRPRHLLRLSGAVLFGGILGPAFLMLGLSRAPAASVSLWLNLEVVATAVLAWALFKEHMHWRTWVAAVFVLGAGILLATPSSPYLTLPVILVVLACICWGVDNNLTAMIDGYTPAQVTLAKGIVAGSVNLILGLMMDGPIRDSRMIGWALLIGALGYGLSIVLYIAGAQRLGASRSQMLFATAPFLGGLISWTALGEPVHAVQIIAAVIMAAGLSLMLSERHHHMHVHEAFTHVHFHSHDDGHHDHPHEDSSPNVAHTHEHSHQRDVHSHQHLPDLHHRHNHS
jgi:drug/metabolite transporter (DMT)-like permease